VALTLLSPLLAHAQTPEVPVNGSPYETDLRIDLPLMIGPLVIAGGAFLIGDELYTPKCLPDCNAEDVNAFDRPFAGTWDRTASTASDVLFISNLTLPHVFGLADAAMTGDWAGYGTDTIVLVEVMSVTLAINTFMSILTQRTRPFVYNTELSDDLRSSGQAALSFYSGHAAASFAMATAYSYTFMTRHPDSPLVIPLWIGSYLMAGTTAGLRVKAGRHFPSDVLVGAAVGAALGMLIPALHLKNKTPTRVEVGGVGMRLLPGAAGAGLGLSVRFDDF
jgi:membrane-associated phospholipid phosphatase